MITPRSLCEGNLDNWIEIERYGWKLNQLRVITILRDMNWYQSIQPLLDQFWNDVELARKGEYNLAPPRAPRTPRATETKFIEEPAE